MNKIEKRFYRMNKFNKNILIKKKQCIMIPQNAPMLSCDFSYMNDLKKLERYREYEGYDQILETDKRKMAEIYYNYSERIWLFFIYIYPAYKITCINIAGNLEYEEIIKNFYRILNNDWYIFKRVCSHLGTEKFEQFIIKYINEKIKDNNINIFNYIDEDIKFKLFINHSNDKIFI